MSRYVVIAPSAGPPPGTQRALRSGLPLPANRVTVLAPALASALGSALAMRLLSAHPPGGPQRWVRTNHAGHAVTLVEGPAYVLGALVGSAFQLWWRPWRPRADVPAVALGGALAALGAGAFGLLDDLAGDRSSKGLRGHLAALRRGRPTTGAAKVAGLGMTGLLTTAVVDAERRGHANRLERRRRPTATLSMLVGGAVVAAAANVSNLLDLRPGRALKAVVLCAIPLLAPDGRPLAQAAIPAHERGRRGAATNGATVAAVAAGAGLGVLRGDLRGVSMLGDTGANSAGAVLGAALVARCGIRGRLAALGVLSGLTLISERVSFTRVIESTPLLRRLDAWGRTRRLPGG